MVLSPRGLRLRPWGGQRRTSNHPGPPPRLTPGEAQPCTPSPRSPDSSLLCSPSSAASRSTPGPPGKLWLPVTPATAGGKTPRSGHPSSGSPASPGKLGPHRVSRHGLGTPHLCRRHPSAARGWAWGSAPACPCLSFPSCKTAERTGGGCSGAAGMWVMPRPHPGLCVWLTRGHTWTKASSRSFISAGFGGTDSTPASSRASGRATEELRRCPPGQGC